VWPLAMHIHAIHVKPTHERFNIYINISKEGEDILWFNYNIKCITFGSVCRVLKWCTLVNRHHGQLCDTVNSPHQASKAQGGTGRQVNADKCWPPADALSFTDHLYDNRTTHSVSYQLPYNVEYTNSRPDTEVKLSTTTIWTVLQKNTCYIVLPWYQSGILPPSVVYRYCFINPNKRRSFALELCCVISVSCDHPLLQPHTGTGLPRTSAPTPPIRRSQTIDDGNDFHTQWTRTSSWGTHVILYNIILDIRTRRICIDNFIFYF